LGGFNTRVGARTVACERSVRRTHMPLMAHPIVPVCAPWCDRRRRWREAGEDRPPQRIALPLYQAGSVPALARAVSCRFVALDADGGRMAGLIWAGLPTLNAVMSSSTWLVVLLKIDTVSVLLVPVTAGTNA
jgi:hypothetical protein